MAFLAARGHYNNSCCAFEQHGRGRPALVPGKGCSVTAVAGLVLTSVFICNVASLYCIPVHQPRLSSHLSTLCKAGGCTAQYKSCVTVLQHGAAEGSKRR